MRVKNEFKPYLLNIHCLAKLCIAKAIDLAFSLDLLYFGKRNRVFLQIRLFILWFRISTQALVNDYL